MEEVLLEEEEQVYVPEVKVFRDYIDHQVWKKKEEILIKLLYLLGARASEVITKVTPFMTAHHMSRPYGQLLKYGFASYKKPDGKETKILLVKSAIAKRLKKKKDLQGKSETSKELQEETIKAAAEQIIDNRLLPAAELQNLVPIPNIVAQPRETDNPVEIVRPPMKYVPIVCDPRAEPWCIDILKWIQAYKAREDALRFDCCEMTVQNIVKKNLRQLDPKIHPHLLRHYRITHLIKAYDFTPYQITAFTGWSMKSTFQQMGVQASSNIDIYAHLQWKDYIDKLLVPLEEIL